MYQLPERVKAFVWDEGDGKQENSLVLENARPRKTKLAFLGYHQVVDRAPSGTADHLILQRVVSRRFYTDSGSVWCGRKVDFRL